MTPSAATLEALRDELAALYAGRLTAQGRWSPAEILAHCAQSVEYSLTAYPQLKPWLVRRLIGPRVLAGFRRQGRMRHDLAAPVPGAPALDERDAGLALQRLIAAIDAFLRHPGPWPEHLAYGHMDRAAYAEAHRLHILNHFETIDTQRDTRQ